MFSSWLSSLLPVKTFVRSLLYWLTVQFIACWAFVRCLLCFSGWLSNLLPVETFVQYVWKFFWYFVEYFHIYFLFSPHFFSFYFLSVMLPLFSDCIFALSGYPIVSNLSLFTIMKTWFIFFFNKCFCNITLLFVSWSTPCGFFIHQCFIYLCHQVFFLSTHDFYHIHCVLSYSFNLKNNQIFIIFWCVFISIRKFMIRVNKNCNALKVRMKNVLFTL